MTLKRLLIIYLALAATVACAQGFQTNDTETCRIRVRNVAGGLVQVSTDGGRTYSAVGRVTTAANARITGFAAASYTPPSTVAATAVHGIRIKTGKFANALGKAQMPLIFSISPLEFASIPKGYGGHLPRSSAVQTDIYTGRSIFRNESPYVGNPVYIEQSHSLATLPEDYDPIGGEVFVIIVKRPTDDVESVEFDNKIGGEVTVIRKGGEKQVIAEVVRPVGAIGRYDATTFTGVGSINTNHGGVITISSAPVCPPKTLEGGPVETRGGFMIQPYYHVREQGEGKSQVMVIAPKVRSKPVLEGTAPLFDGYINLSRYSNSPECSCRAQVKIDDGDWENVPEIVGKVDDAFTPAYLESHFAKIGKPRKVTHGVTAVRLLLPKYDTAVMSKDIAKETAEYISRAKNSSAKPIHGTIALGPADPSKRKRTVNFYIDGNPIYLCNTYPYRYDWDSHSIKNGFHEVEIETSSEYGEPKREIRYILVENL